MNETAKKNPEIGPDLPCEGVGSLKSSVLIGGRLGVDPCCRINTPEKYYGRG
jgi:hypothetical protein